MCISSHRICGLLSFWFCVLLPEFYLHSFQSFAKKLLYYLSSRDPPLHSARYIYRRSHSVDIEEVVDERKTLRCYFKYRYHMLYTLTDAKEQALHTEWKKKDYPEYNIFHICSFSWFNDSILWQGIFRLTDHLVGSITITVFNSEFTNRTYRNLIKRHFFYLEQLHFFSKRLRKECICTYAHYFCERNITSSELLVKKYF